MSTELEVGIVKNSVKDDYAYVLQAYTVLSDYEFYDLLTEKSKKTVKKVSWPFLSEFSVVEGYGQLFEHEVTLIRKTIEESEGFDIIYVSDFKSVILKKKNIGQDPYLMYLLSKLSTIPQSKELVLRFH